MRIIHLVSNKVWGGGEQYVLDLAKEFATRGCKVSIVSRDIDAVTNRFKAAGLPPTTMALKGAIDIVSPLRLARMVAGDEPVIIHVHNFKDATTAVRARALSRNRNVRIVMTRHLVKQAKRSTLYNRLDAMIFVSQLACNEFMSGTPAIDATKVHVIHNSIKLPPAATESSPNEGLTYMFHGRLSPEKGIDTLLQAFAMADMPHARLVIAGSGNGEYVKTLHGVAARSGIAQQITWTGHVSDIHPLIQKAEVGVCPSHVREAGSLSVLEYMSHGKPVVASDNGSQPEYITNGKEGFLVQPGDADALAAAIRRLGNAAERKAMGVEAQKSFEERLAFPIFIAKIENVYNTVLDK